jgi:ASC-1-like (ASCH) protein
MARTKTLWIKEAYLQQILAGHKTVEIRVGYSNITRLKPGDLLLLNGQYPYRLATVRHYPDFEAMAAAEDPAAVAPKLADAAALLAACRAIYPPDKEALGVVALEIVAETSPKNKASI